MDGASEILRLRERSHKLEKSVWSIRELELDLRRRLDSLEPQVRAIVDADKIAAAVAQSMRSERNIRLSWGTRLAGLTVGTLTAVDLVLRITHGV